MPDSKILEPVKLYYLGGLAHSENPFVTSKGKAFALPPVGGYLTVPGFTATDLIRRNQVVTPQGRFSVFTLDARAANRAAQGPAPVVAQTRELTREDLLAMLADLDAKDDDKAIEDPSEPVVTTKKSKKAEEVHANEPEASQAAKADKKENK